MINTSSKHLPLKPFNGIVAVVGTGSMSMAVSAETGSNTLWYEAAQGEKDSSARKKV